jgi:prepilin-type N-terminal cleavage/methylation domain-containing protein
MYNNSKNIKKAKKIKGFTLIEVMIAVAIIGILFNIAVPSLVRAREQARAKSCTLNLKRLDSAKQQWAISNKKSGTATPVESELYGNNLYIKGVAKTCPAGYTYTIGDINTDPRCGLGTSFAPYYHTLSGQL